MGLEIEVKARVQDKFAVREALSRIGAQLTRQQYFEDNFLYDFPDGRLRDRGEALRVRLTDEGASLTFKGATRPHPQLKLREEVEVRVDDGIALCRMLERLGLVKVFRYQKYRTEYLVESGSTGQEKVRVVVDETPMGDFMEIEGGEQAVLQTAWRLGLVEGELIRETYLSLYAEFCKENNLGFGDMVF